MENTELVVKEGTNLDPQFRPSKTQSVKEDTHNQDQPHDEYDLAKAIELSLKESEQATARKALDEVDPNVEDTATNLQFHECPICDESLSLTAAAFTAHVNQCLDAPSTEVTATRGAPRDEKSPTPSTWKDFFGLASSKSLLSTETSFVAVQQKTKKNRGMKRECPSYKWMQDTHYVVDAFSYGKILDCDGYFLSHFHSDHYTNLSSSWSAGTIYCSRITANLVLKKLKVDPKYICALPMNEYLQINSNVSVGLIDANHCPGSVLFLFNVQLPNGKYARHLHTGDFRANPRMCLHPFLQQPANAPIDTLYLDTTYLNPKYSFPAQEECIEAACSVVKQLSDLEESGRPKTMMESWIKRTPKDPASNTCTKKARLLVVVGTYTIGKEKVFYNIAKMLGSKLYVTRAKREILGCQEDPDLESMLTDDQTEAQVHVVPLQDIKADNMNAYFKSLEPHFSSLAAFRPTGWTFRPSAAETSAMAHASLDAITAPPSERSLILKPQHTSPQVKIYGVPYSEHSSFRELASFIGSLEIKRIIPTVNMGSEESRLTMASYYETWQREKEEKKVIRVVPYPTENHW